MLAGSDQERVDFMKKLDFTKLQNIDDRTNSLKYLRWFIRNHRVTDDEHSDWMLFAAQIEAQFVHFKEDAKLKTIWKEVYKSILYSEEELKYRIYKGNVLVRLAMTALVSTGELDDGLRWLIKAQEEDKLFYKNPDYRPAYKMLSFLEPLVLFKDQLWPSSLESKREIAWQLYVLMPFCRGASAIAYKPGFLSDGIKDSIKDTKLAAILLENIEELETIGELCDKNKKFYKSMMFLVANVIEGVLLYKCLTN